MFGVSFEEIAPVLERSPLLARGTPFAPFARHAVVDGHAGVFVKVDDRLRSVVKFTIEGDRAVAMDLTIDPGTLARLRI
jgi:hypothetical protein